MRILFITVLAVLTGLAGNAQLSNSGVFFVSNSTPVYLGDFTNTSAGAFTNNGTTHFTGNLANNQANMPAGSGTVIFDGTSAQTLSGSAPFRSLNITINNAAGLTLTSRLAVGDGTGGTLSFTAGHIISGNNTQDVYFYPGSAYTGFGIPSHVIGFVTKSGNSSFVFPVGNGAHTAALGITGVSSTSDFQVLYTGGGYGAYAVTPPLITGGVFANEWWDLARNAGTGSCRVTLNWDDSRQKLNHINPGGLVVAHRTPGTWVSVGGSSSNAAGSSTGSVGPSNSLSSFSPFTFGSTTVALPIILTDFTVVNENCQAFLSWTTSLEQNAANFEIQQSTDGVNFTTVSTVKAADTPSTYHLTLAQPTQQAFYRLRMVDLDGTGVYSNIAGLILACLPSTDHLALYPNPLTTGSVLQARLTTPNARGTAMIQVFDGAGRKIYSNNITVIAGSNEYTIPAGGFAPGVYSVVVIGEGWKSEVVLFSR